MDGRLLIAFAALILLHAAFSAYEHLSLLKALGKPESSLPYDIAVEALVALVLGTVGASLSTPPLKQISWANEMKTRSAEEMNARPGFADWGAQAKSLKSVKS